MEGDSLEGESTALDLLAVASGVELLEVGLVLAGDEGIGEPGNERKMTIRKFCNRTFLTLLSIIIVHVVQKSKSEIW